MSGKNQHWGSTLDDFLHEEGIYDAAKAAAHYKKVIEQFPGTSFADEASAEMKTLEGKK